MCTEGGSSYIKEQIIDSKLERIVVAACSPRTHEPVFHAILTEAGLPPRYLEFVNIREHCSFVHQAPEVREKAIAKAIELIRAGIARARLLEAVATKSLSNWWWNRRVINSCRSSRFRV